MNLNDDRGSSTAEFAVLLPSIALMVSLLLCFGVLGMQQIRVQQAAGAMARELARGEDTGTARASGARLAGEGASFSLSTGGEYSTVTVAKSINIPLVGPVRVHGTASVANEQ
ncbi:TadE family type IV pilus minor pilin [Glutamicibacter sp.]|uniref:TadE family type IV pilus minor pilin n=1 Tax=Glutamicibacter sp. TaxID=1931995 RepID=UPI0028BE51A0|nr:TadE family type IV pilus minor pilin [Glutamicibacter sp.]